MDSNFEENVMHSFNIPQTFGQATLELSQLLIKEEMGQPLTLDEIRKKGYMMLVLEKMIKEKNSRANIGKNMVAGRRKTRKQRRKQTKKERL